MQPKQFNTLALAAVISLIAAGVVHSSYNSFNEETVSGKRLFPSLESQGNSTEQIAIQKGEEKLTLKKVDDGKVWSIVERAGYPVDGQKVRELVLKLGQAELIEPKTANESLYSQLDLGDPAAKDADAKMVRLSDAKNKTLAEVVVGKERRAAFGQGKSGTYVRVPGDKQTWLAKLELNASTEIVDWVKPAFFVVENDKIASLAVKEGDKSIYTLGLVDKKKNDFKLIDIPDGKKQNEKLRISDLVTGIRTLEMIDVRKAGAADAKPDMTAELTTKDGAKYRIGMKREDKKRWMTVNVLANGKDVAAAKKLAEATKGWAFEIADWRADQTFKKIDDVFEAAKVEAPKAAAPDNAPKAPEPANAAAPKQ